MKRVSPGWFRLKLVNESTREARIGSAVNTTRPKSHGDRNARPHHVSRRWRLIPFLGGAWTDCLSSTITIDSLRNRLGMARAAGTLSAARGLLTHEVGCELRYGAALKSAWRAVT